MFKIKNEFEKIVSEPAVQNYLVEICDIQQNSPLIAVWPVNDVEGGVFCGMRHFKMWAEEIGEGFPVARRPPSLDSHSTFI